MIETKEREIDGKRVSVTQFPGRKALALKTRLIKLFGPVLGSVIGGMNGVDLNTEVSLSFISGAMDKLASQIDENDFVKLILELMSSTRIEVDGKLLEVKEQIFDIEFAGKLLYMYKIVAFILEVNYSSFFENAAIGRILSRIKTTAATVTTESGIKSGASTKLQATN